MKAKTYLKRLKYIETALRLNREELQRLKERTLAIGGTSSDGERVKSSNVIEDRFAQCVAEYVDLAADIISKEVELEKERKAIINNMSKLDQEEYEILYKIYVAGKSLQETADEMDRSYSFVTSKHGTALAHLQKILNKEAKQ